MSDRKYIILRKQIHEPTQPTTYVEVARIEQREDEYLSAKTALRRALEETTWPEFRQGPEAEYLVIEHDYSVKRMTVKARTEFDFEEIAESEEVVA